MTTLTLLSTIVGIIMASSGIPQAIKIFRRKSAKDISGLTYMILIPGGIIWIFYGTEINSIPIILTNVIAIIVSVMILIGWFLYGKK